MKFVAWVAYHLETREIVDDYIARIKPYLDGHEFVVCEDLESVKQEIADADAMIGWRITPEVFAHAKKLRWIQFGSAGIDHTIFPELLSSDVVLTTLSGIHTNAVSEHVFALMLTISRRLDLAARLQMERSYDRSELAATSFELAGKTIGIVGLGKIGRGIALRAKAFAMRVIGTKRDVSTPVEHVDKLYSPDELDNILVAADFLVLVTPLTSATRALIGRREIGLMKHGACIVNVARGAMLDHYALGEALASGKLRGAALDVFPEEPLPPESPIYDVPNVIITPHTAGSHPGYSIRAAEIFKTNLDAFTSGGQMINVFDRARGY